MKTIKLSQQSEDNSQAAHLTPSKIASTDMFTEMKTSQSQSENAELTKLTSSSDISISSDVAIVTKKQLQLHKPKRTPQQFARCPSFSADDGDKLPLLTCPKLNRK